MEGLVMNKKTYTKEERATYYKQLRERWNKAKEIGNEDEIKAVMMQHGLNFSVRSYCYVMMQLRALGLEGIPYVDTKTFMGWKENGFMVRKGEKSNIDGITWIGIDGKEKTDEGEKEHHYAMPKAYHLFHKSQVEAA
jgi:hypothetical protein